MKKDGEMMDITIKLGDISLNQLRDLLITAGSVKVPLSETCFHKNNYEFKRDNTKESGTDILHLWYGQH